MNLYEKNGLVFWTQYEIRERRRCEEIFFEAIEQNLKEQNRAFQFFQVEAPLLTPRSKINPNYTDQDVFVLDDLALRPETTMGSYAYAEYLLNSCQGIKMPMVVWQHGKSFRREQDQPTKFMRLKEFYQLEFQIIFAENTKNDYSVSLIPAVAAAISRVVGPCRVEDSDRLPDYSNWTKDVVCSKNDMEVCSISSRKDFPNAKVLEVAIGTDRCVYCSK
jgi:glycyl-tRNA synthetase